MFKPKPLNDTFQGCLLGLAIGDAIGTTAEFKKRGTFPPVLDMVGGGAFNLEPGQWTDDTSMALCLATSLIECNGFDAADQMERYLAWFRKGYLSSTGECFDIGCTVRDALEMYSETGIPFTGSTHYQASGNGCLMRLAPISMWFYSDENLLDYASQSSRTTHGSKLCIEATQLFASMIQKALAGASKNEILFDHNAEFISFVSPEIQKIAAGNYRCKSIGEIRGTGYVVDSLEAALWCFFKSSSYAEAILTATNLGDDADTTAAICGQLAGAFYGKSGIPQQWFDKLYMRDEIVGFTESLLHHRKV